MTLHRILTADLLASELEFATARSSGPGGQNVNKVNSKVTLRWNISDSKLITWRKKNCFYTKLATRLTVEGILLITAQTGAPNYKIKKRCYRKFEVLLKQSFAKKKKRKATKPSKSAMQKRLDKKEKNISDKKKGRQNRY